MTTTGRPFNVTAPGAVGPELRKARRHPPLRFPPVSRIDMTLRRHLQALGVDIVSTLEQLDAPVALVDPCGRLLWQNRAAVELVGDLRGMDLAAVAPDYQKQSRGALARKSMGLDRIAHAGLVIVGADGSRKRVETTSLSLIKGTELVGILGIVNTIADGDGQAGAARLTPRLQETLRLLASGLSTEEIASALGVTRETARNYIRRLLRTLGVHSRLEAVVHGRETGLI
jgi:DNA-binding CsgD family transcriptional regulator